MKRFLFAIILIVGTTSFAQTSRFPRAPQPGPLQERMVCFYENSFYRGNRVCFHEGQEVSDLSQMNMNDQISSIQLIGFASITIYENANFGGDQMTVSTSIPDLSQLSRNHGSWNDSITSFSWQSHRPVPPRPPMPPPQPRGQACFFSDAHFTGRSFCLHEGESLRNLSAQGLNDSISSIQISGRVSVVLFENANFGGDQVTLNRDAEDLSQISRQGHKNWNDVISSVEVQ